MMSRITYLLLETLISALPMALGRPVTLITKLMTLEPAIRNMMTAVVSQASSRILGRSLILMLRYV